jgi:hypothetical protein
MFPQKPKVDCKKTYLLLLSTREMRHEKLLIYEVHFNHLSRISCMCLSVKMIYSNMFIYVNNFFFFSEFQTTFCKVQAADK